MPETLSPDLPALCAALDAGDDAMPVLADLLEEAGDARAAGMRRAGDRRPHADDGGARWVEEGTRPAGLSVLPRAVYLALEGWSWRQLGHVCYPTRSAAMLALAEALAREG